MSFVRGNISVYERYNNSDVLFFQRFAPYVTVIERSNFPMWAVIGIPGGIFSIFLWISRPMRRGGSATAAIYQACLGGVDVSFFFTYLLWYLHVAWQQPVLDHPGICQIFPVLNYLIQYLSPTLTVTFTMERFLAICYPFRSQYSFIRSSTKNALKLVILLVVLCLLTASVQAIVYTFDGQFCSTRAQINDEEHVAHTVYTYWTFLSEVLYFFILPITCLILNLFVIRVLRGTTRIKQLTLLSLSRQNSVVDHLAIDSCGVPEIGVEDGQNMNKGVRSSTLTLLCTSFYVIFAHLSVALALLIHTLLPTGDVMLSDEEIERDPAWRRYFLFFTIRMLIESFAMTHYAAKFPIYLLTSKQFRTEFLKLFDCHKAKQNHHFGANPLKYTFSSDDFPRRSERATSVDCGLGYGEDFSLPVATNGHADKLSEHMKKTTRWFSRTAARQRPSDSDYPRKRPSPGLMRAVIGEDGQRVFAVT